MAKIEVKGTEIRIVTIHEDDYISLTDMLKAKDGDFFISDWLRNRNTVEYLGIWEKIHNPDFNYGEFAIIKSQAGLHNLKRCQAKSTSPPGDKTITYSIKEL
jgi:hypothetical protein